MTQVGTVKGIWRFPVKSMLGEELQASDVTPRGILGDRAFALIDAQTGKVASAKNPRRWPNLFQCRAAFTEPPQNGRELPPVRITLPDSAVVQSDDPAANDALSEVLGRKVTLKRQPPAQPVLEEFWPDMEDLSPQGHRDTVTDERIAAAAPGTFFDATPLSAVTTGTLDKLGELYPQGRFDLRRFRMNLVIETEATGFVENGWIGSALAIGDVRLPVLLADPRCVMTTLAQEDLPNDPGILRAAAQHNTVEIPGLGRYPCVGVYAGVAAAGTVRRSDPVSLA